MDRISIRGVADSGVLFRNAQVESEVLSEGSAGGIKLNLRCRMKKRRAIGGAWRGRRKEAPQKRSVEISDVALQFGNEDEVGTT